MRDKDMTLDEAYRYFFFYRIFIERLGAFVYDMTPDCRYKLYFKVMLEGSDKILYLPKNETVRLV